jgi:glycosyltransferase involved in cell wall biosynthesis
LNLLFVVPCYFPATRFGGPVRSVHALAKGLHALGDRVSVYTTNSDGPRDLPCRLGEPTSMDGVSVTYFQVEKPRGYFRSPALDAALGRDVARFDLVYAPWIYAHTTQAAARRALASRIPFVVSPRGMLDRDSIRRKGRWRKTAFLATLGRRALAGAEAIHFTSAGERENCVKRFPVERSFVAPNGVDVDELASGATPPHEPVVLFLGRLSAIKGLDLIAAAWPRVLAAVPGAKLVLAGPDDEGLAAGMRSAFAASGTAASVTWTGLVDAQRRNALLARAAVLLNPSYLESFGMSIVEAMACGKPVVVTDRVNIAPDIAAAGAGLVCPCDPGEIAQAVVRLLSDSSLAGTMGAAGRALVDREYAIGPAARRVHDAFASIVARRGGVR